MRWGWFLVSAGVALGCGGEGEPVVAPPAPNLGHKPKAGPPANVVGGFAIEIPALTLEPGEERFPCFIFPLVVEGPSAVVGGGKLVTGPGMHHGNVTTRPATGEGIRPCSPEDNQGLGEAGDILDGGSVLFGSSTQFVGEEWQSFPDGMGYPLARDGFEIVARMHYLNSTTEPLTVTPSYEWFTIDEATVDHLLGPFAWNFVDFEIPPLSEHTVTAECDVPGPMQIVNVLPHMHALGRAFFGEYYGGEREGERWLDSVGYDPDNGVMTQYDPAIDLSQGYGARWGCTWKNTHERPIYEGVGDNEMCILFGYAYPYEHAYSAQTNGNGCLMIPPPPPGGG